MLLNLSSCWPLNTNMSLLSGNPFRCFFFLEQHSDHEYKRASNTQWYSEVFWGIAAHSKQHKTWLCNFLMSIVLRSLLLQIFTGLCLQSDRLKADPCSVYLFWRDTFKGRLTGEDLMLQLKRAARGSQGWLKEMNFCCFLQCDEILLSSLKSSEIIHLEKVYVSQLFAILTTT